MRDLATCYAAALNDQPTEIAPSAIQYADYARWQLALPRHRGDA